eukprot:363350-Chlamydomonas_euryale.AAC.2
MASRCSEFARAMSCDNHSRAMGPGRRPHEFQGPASILWIEAASTPRGQGQPAPWFDDLPAA